MTARVVGIGGTFFKARDPEALRAWYRDHLGLDITENTIRATRSACSSPASASSGATR